MTKILLATNGSGYQVDKCLEIPFFRDSVGAIVSDRSCPALEVGRKHGVDSLDLGEKDLVRLNAQILDVAVQREVDCIISPGFTRIFGAEILERFENRVFNCHPAILPAFRGFYDTRDTRRKFHARKIFERTLEFGSRVTGNTIHVVTGSVDEGRPIIVSTMNLPYGEEVGFTRHRLFVQECQCLLQLVSWLNQGRLRFEEGGLPVIEAASFDQPGFSPNLDDPRVREFDLPYPF